MADRRDQCGVGAKGWVATTKGARDILLLQRHDKTAIYDLHYAKPAPVVARRDTEIDERMAADGSVVRAMDGGRGDGCSCGA